MTIVLGLLCAGAFAAPRPPAKLPVRAVVPRLPAVFAAPAPAVAAATPSAGARPASALSQVVLMSGAHQDPGAGRPQPAVGRLFDGSIGRQVDETAVVIVLDDPGSEAALQARLAGWAKTHGFRVDYSFPPSRRADGRLIVRGAIPEDMRLWLKGAGALEVETSVSQPSALVLDPYEAPAAESAFRALARRAFQLSEPLAMLASIPYFLAALPALFGPAVVGVLVSDARPAFAAAVLTGAAGLMSIVQPMEILFEKVSRTFRLLTAHAGLAAAAAMTIADGQALAGVLGVAAAFLGWKAFGAELAAGGSRHPIDAFVVGLTVNAAITAFGGALLALYFSASHPAFALATLAVSIGTFGLMALKSRF